MAMRLSSVCWTGGRAPDTLDVRGTNFCDIGWAVDPGSGRLILMSAIDNLVKGAAGQAVQNMNLMFGFEESAGLDAFPIRCSCGGRFQKDRFVDIQDVLD
jgi:N-acetyl-gamma-glutamylphosphate reductase